MNKPVRLFPNTVAGVIQGLQETFGDELYANKVVEQLFRDNKKWGKRDRAFIASSIYGIVRHWRKLWAMLDKPESTHIPELYNVFGVYWLWQENTLPEWTEFEELANFNLETALANLPKDIGVTESYPIWLNDLATKELGSEWEQIATNLNLPAPVALRVNTLKSDKNRLKKILQNEGIETFINASFPDVLFLEKRPNLKLLDSFNQGLFEVQDAGSQEIGKFLNPQPKTVVVDACSGAGGKALQMAALMENTGSILSLDIYQRKLDEQEKRAKRNKVRIINTEAILNEDTILRHKAKADSLLLDVPCSGTGVIRREPDTKWKLSEESLAEVISLQKEILESHSVMVKPRGTIVYATCSILKSENEDQVQWFLSKNSDFKLDQEMRINPGPLSDGFYMARLIKS